MSTRQVTNEALNAAIKAIFILLYSVEWLLEPWGRFKVQIGLALTFHMWLVLALGVIWCFGPLELPLTGA